MEEDYQESISTIRAHIQEINSDPTLFASTSDTTTLGGNKKTPSESNALSNHIKELQFKNQRHLYRNGKDPHKAIRIANEAMILTEYTYPCWSAIPEEEKRELLSTYLQSIVSWDNDDQLQQVMSTLLENVRYKKNLRWVNGAIELVDVYIENHELKKVPKVTTTAGTFTGTSRATKRSESMRQIKHSIQKLRQEHEKQFA